MPYELTFEMEPFGGYEVYDEILGEEPDLCALKKGPGWEAAWRFATAIRKQGFLPAFHFIQRICKRVIGERLSVNPSTFKNDFFYRSSHYRQTTPGKKSLIAVVNGIPIFYRKGGWAGRQIVLISAYEPGYKLPPHERIKAPVIREAPVCPTCGM